MAKLKYTVPTSQLIALRLEAALLEASPTEGLNLTNQNADLDDKSSRRDWEEEEDFDDENEW